MKSIYCINPNDLNKEVKTMPERLINYLYICNYIAPVRMYLTLLATLANIVHSIKKNKLKVKERIRRVIERKLK